MLKSHTEGVSWRSRGRPATHTVGKFYLITKRVIDVVLATVALVLLSPVLVLIAVAIRLDSPGPIVFVQHRIGLGGRPFRFYKFRSMVSDQDHTHVHREFAHRYINGHTLEGYRSGHVFKPASNQRIITRVGRILRKTSLDELPQLVNVIKGDMSLVGPRPPMAYEVEAYADWHWRRLEVVPGLTGLAQISGRSRLTFDEIVRLDLKYIESRSVLTDFGIMLRTIPALITGRDAG